MNIFPHIRNFQKGYLYFDFIVNQIWATHMIHVFTKKVFVNLKNL